MNTHLKLIGIGLLISIALSAWAVYEISSINKELLVINKDITNILEEVKAIKTRPAPAARPDTAPTQPQNVKVSIDDDPIRGNKDAPVTIIEFSDYQCPFCKRFYDQVVPSIEEDYVSKGKVRLVFRDYPLQFHKKAVPAAIAANCAGEQGKYWEVHDFLFENPEKLDTDAVLSSTQELGLDHGKFEKCVNDKAAKEAEIKNDFADGQKYGVTGTPSFFIGKTGDGKEMTGIYVRGAQPYHVFKNHIDKLLEETN